jgi:predicted P-loop ATPase
MKAFFARRQDTYRPPYGRVNATTPRRCVYVSTTNQKEYLQLDPSGYRRYWPARARGSTSRPSSATATSSR